MNYCFIDTNFFLGKDKNICNFWKPQFKYFTILSSYGICQLVVPEVMKIELYAHFKEKTDQIDARIREIGLPTSLIEAVDGISEASYTQLVSSFEKFLKEAKAIELSMSSLEVDATSFVNLRYKKEHPFNADKQNEYQDLFIIQSLNLFINGHPKDKLIIFTKDKGFIEYCKKLLPQERTSYYSKFEDYRPLEPQNENENKIREITQLFVNRTISRLEEYVDNALLDENVPLPSRYSMYQSQEHTVLLSNPVVESIDTFDSEIYAYVACNCCYRAQANAFNEEKSDYNWSTHRFRTMVYEDVNIYKDVEIRFIVNLIADVNEYGEIVGIDDINEIDISSDFPFEIDEKDLSTKITSVIRQEDPFWES